MAKARKFYITTAIDYTNSLPHIGHSYQKVLADVLKRWHQSLGYDSLYLTGTDEHGLKIQRAAQAANKEPQDFVDDIAAEFQKAWKKLNINYDIFLRTTSEQHKKAVKEFIKRIAKKGDIYKGAYEGLYCVGCETFYTEKDLINGKVCPIHKNEAELIKEESYFFKLSKYQKKLLELYENNPEFISPENRRQEIINRVKEGLKDLSVSRSSLQWGVPFPLDEKHVTYIWFEALQCYVSGLDFPNGKNFKKFWPADAQLLGTDNGWFHTVIWPAMLFSAGLKIPKKIYIHSFLTLDGQKISKSLGNTINPGVLVDKYGADAVRYAFLRELDPKTDSDFSEKVLFERLNSDLANSLGNLLSRTLTLIEKNTAGKVPKGKTDSNMKKLFETTLKDVSRDVTEIELHHALEKIFGFIGACNKYVDEQKPWELVKTNDQKLKTILYNLAECLRVISALAWPFIPESAEKIAKQLGVELPKLKNIKYGAIKVGTKVNKGEILFKKTEKFEPVQLRITPKSVTYCTSSADLRVGEIKSVDVVADSDKLLKLQIDVGQLGERQIVAGIRKFYKPQELIGKKIIIVANLKPAKIRGEISQGMLLAAVDDKQDEVISPVGENGRKVLADNINFGPAAEIEIEELEKLSLKIENNRLTANGNILKTPQGEVKTRFIANGSVR
ncbi:MAG: methionine--tRNA ligase [DPANN group archaeon]|nr:methionine--tRNA ligase [DPANN group archaeon]